MLISLANAEDWEIAVSRVPHGPAHTHWYNAALAASIEDEIVLFEYASGEDRAVCPIVQRRYGKSVDVATPYGFGGFTSHGQCSGLPDEFRRLAIEQRWVCGYLALHPLFPHPFVVSDGLEPGRTTYVLDLSISEDLLLASMHETHRYELRKDSVLLESIIMEDDPLGRALPALYAETVARVGASNTYHFSETTLNTWVRSPGSLVLGIGEPPQAMVVCIHTKDIADYFINASTNQGRRYTRILLWAAARELKRRGVRYFNLGGGVREGDTLEAFKRRFGGTPLNVPVLKQVFLPEEFMALSGQAEAVDRAGYFPPYRSF
ncbi:MAG: hypothetical protein M3R69_02210 [Acidobacteriota bacterium]|nr:hypothetical protein [Acidobacteriota bacterium]